MFIKYLHIFIFKFIFNYLVVWLKSIDERFRIKKMETKILISMTIHYTTKWKRKNVYPVERNIKLLKKNLTFYISKVTNLEVLYGKKNEVIRQWRDQEWYENYKTELIIMRCFWLFLNNKKKTLFLTGWSIICWSWRSWRPGRSWWSWKC